MLIITKETSLYLNLAVSGSMSYTIGYRLVDENLDKGPLKEVKGLITASGDNILLSGTNPPEVSAIETIIIVNNNITPIDVIVKTIEHGISIPLSMGTVKGYGSLEYTTNMGFTLKGEGSANVTTINKDRYGVDLPDVIVNTSSPNVDWYNYDMTPLALSKDSTWAGFITDLQTAFSDIKTLGILNRIIAVYPNVGGTSALHKWNWRYPFDDTRAHRAVYNSVVHTAFGLEFNGFRWLYPNINLVSFTNSLDMAIGVAFTTDLSSAGDATVWDAYSYTGTEGYLNINNTSGLISYKLHGVAGTYTPGTIPTDYTGKRYVVAREGNDVKLYIDGAKVATTTGAPATYGTGWPWANNMRFGGNGYGSTELTATLGFIYIASDLLEAEIISFDAIIATLETAVR